MSMQKCGVSGRVISSAVARSMAWIAPRAAGCSRSARLGGSPEVTLVAAGRETLMLLLVDDDLGQLTLRTLRPWHRLQASRS
jgi:hypothetical protein